MPLSCRRGVAKALLHRQSDALLRPHAGHFARYRSSSGRGAFSSWYEPGAQGVHLEHTRTVPDTTAQQTFFFSCDQCRTARTLSLRRTPRRSQGTGSLRRS